MAREIYVDVYTEQHGYGYTAPLSELAASLRVDLLQFKDGVTIIKHKGRMSRATFENSAEFDGWD